MVAYRTLSYCRDTSSVGLKQLLRPLKQHGQEGISIGKGSSGSPGGSSSSYYRIVASSAFVHGRKMHAGGQSKGIGVEHGIVGVEEVVVAHAIEDMTAVVGS